MAKLTELQTFYSSLQTMPKLISDLALSIAEAQRRLDVTYVQDLTDFLKLMARFFGDNKQPPEALLALFRAMGPTRYQFTETVVETRADLQMTVASEASIGGTLGFNAPFAVSVNASYMRRSGMDARAAATIRTVLHAISSDQAVGEALLKAAQSATSAELPDSSRYKALQDVFGDLNKSLPAAKTGEKKKEGGAGNEETPAEEGGGGATPAGGGGNTPGAGGGATPTGGND